jgi:hypothetical protein
MKVSRFLSVISILLTSVCTFAFGNDTTVTAAPDSLKSPVALSVADSITSPNVLASFTEINKKYLKKSIITNIIFLSGFSLWRSVVYPGLNKADNTTDQLKWYPLAYLSAGMMYASLPINVLSSYRARNNYKYYYKTAPSNFALPILFTGAGLCIGSAGFGLWNTISDYRDNKELDQSYNKYGKLSQGLISAGLITFACSNIYSLVYTIVLGEKAKTHTASETTSLQISPMRYGDANGCIMTWNF